MNSEGLLEQYKKLHRGEGSFFYKGEPTTFTSELWDGRCFEQKLLSLFNKIVSKRSSFRVLDYGCGKALYTSYIHALYLGRLQEWYCYDPGYERYANSPSGTFDFVICADVMEHVLDYEETLTKISGHLERNGIALFSISGNLDSRAFDNGLNMHVTLKSFDDWKGLLKKHFGAKKVILVYNSKYYWESWHATV